MSPDPLPALLTRDCHRCEGPLQEIRRECADDALVVHVRCTGRCRGGGHVAFDRGDMDSQPLLVGPIFPGGIGRTTAGPEAEHRGRAGV